MFRVNVGGLFEHYRLPLTLFGFVGLWVFSYIWFDRSQGGSNVISSKENIHSSMSKSVIMEQDEPQSEHQTTLEPEHGTKVKIMTWNLQGLLREELEKRTEAVITVISREGPDAVFFQELVPATFKQLTDSLQPYYSAVRGSKGIFSGYFTGIFYRKDRYKQKSHQVIPFSNSVMDRTLLIVKLKSIARRKLKLALLTSHLESLPNFRDSRVEQLKQSFEICTSLNDSYNVIFGGDLNLEDGEDEGMVPGSVNDVWKACGSSDESKYSWDMVENTNERVADVAVENQPRRRYDRLYFRASATSPLHLSSFQLSGKKLVEGLPYFPSDHWALMSTFHFSRKERSGKSTN